MRSIYRLLSLFGDVKAASRGPASYTRRQVRRQANKHFNRGLRRLLKP